MYVIDYNSDEPIMLLDQQIGVGEDGVGIDGSLFARELLELDGMGKKRIQVWINSPGGAVTEGWAICNAINASETKVDTRCIGMAASIAGVIFQYGRKREMNDYGILMYHNPYDVTDETSKDPMIEVMRKSIITMIESKSGMSPADVETMMHATTFLTADESLAKGLCDTIINSEDLNVKRKLPAKTDIANYHQISNQINFIKMAFPKVANKLNLNESASEDAIVLAITDMQNKLDTSVLLNKKSKEDLDKMKNDMDEAENKFKDLAAKFKTASDELDNVKDLANTAKCENMVKKYADVGRIKNDKTNIDRFVAMAKVAFDETEALIKDLPLNKESKTLVVAAEVTGQGNVYNMAHAMITISNKAKK